MMNIFLRCLALFCMSVCSMGCDKLYTLLHKEGAEEKAIIGNLVPLESNPTVEEIQSLLNIYGYACGEPDGVLGGMTREAIARFQEDTGLEVTRFVDDNTWARLKEFRDMGFVKGNELNVAFIQDILNRSGFQAGKPDGTIGPKTVQAVKDFQKKNGLNADGKIGYKTLSALSEHLPENRTFAESTSGL